MTLMLIRTSHYDLCIWVYTVLYAQHCTLQQLSHDSVFRPKVRPPYCAFMLGVDVLMSGWFENKGCLTAIHFTAM